MRGVTSLLVACITATFANAFTTIPSIAARQLVTTAGCPKRQVGIATRLMAQISEKEASSAIDKVVDALRKDKEANQELGRLTKTNNILGFGSPRPGTIAVRFNASFQKGGMGRSAIPLPFGLGQIPLPFGLGQTNKSEGGVTMVGQVKASVDAKTGKVLDVTVLRELGNGFSFKLKIGRSGIPLPFGLGQIPLPFGLGQTNK